MAGLSEASSEFIDVFRRGLNAYDQDDYERAYDLFGDALDIEPDNVWALLWRGATAPTPRDTELWLEQALELEPGNPHAQAGLEWARSAEEVEPADAMEADADVLTPEPAFDEVEDDEFDEDAFDWLDEEPADEAVQADEADVAEAEAFFDVDEEDDVPDWLQDEEEPSASVIDVEPDVDEEDDVPDWLRDDADDEGPIGAPEADVIDAEEDEFDAFGDDDVPDWLLEEDEEELEPDVPAEPDIPAVAQEEPAGDAGLPSWLTEEDEEEEAAATTAETYETPEGSIKAPNETVAAFQAGLDAYDRNDLEAAQRHFQRTIQLDNTHVEAHNYLGSVYFLQGQTDDAVDSFNRALALDDTHAESYLNLGLVYQEMGDREQAVDMFEQYLDLDPESSIADDVRGFIDSLR